MERKQVSIPAPKFDIYEPVSIELGDRQYKTKITKRFFDPELNQWIYEVSSIKPVVNESDLHLRQLV